ncbi:G-protein-signaling modulator 2-like [Acropora millepora]|uniref:G-protein-signaling modulator 2-like n=1 Tax=Acropora millepora TaxID=45264 RepID=UPI001CF2F7F9|nr:G-protein-signaling modulator 2-like [Acropora millepora]
MDDKAEKETTSKNRGTDFHSRGELGQDIECHEKDLEIAIEIGDRAREGNAYGNLGNTYRLLGKFRRAIEYHEKNLRLAIETGDRAGEGEAYGNLGCAYDSMGDFPKAIEYHEKYLKLAIEIGDLDGKERACGGLGNAYDSLGDFRKAIDHWVSIEKTLSFIKKDLKIAEEVGDGLEKEERMEISALISRLVYCGKNTEYHEKDLTFAIEVSDRGGEARTYHNIGNIYFSIEQFENAVNNFVSQVAAVTRYNVIGSIPKPKTKG